MIARISLARLALALAAVAGSARAADPIRDLQAKAMADPDTKAARAYHFGSQGPNDVYSNHKSHTNRLIPVYTFGKRVDLAGVTGANSIYRDASRVKALYGFAPEHTVNPEAEYADQSDLHRVQVEAVARGVKHLFIVWFDGMDWETTQAAAVAKSGKVYDKGKGSGLFFQDYDAQGSAHFGSVVTSPTHDKNDPDIDRQVVTIPSNSSRGGYDARIAGPNPWTPGPISAPGYLKGQSGNAADLKGLAAAGGVVHAYTDSSSSAGEVATGVKSYNNGLNVTDTGAFVPTLFQKLQGQGWKVGTVTSVPFDHASPAAMYAHDVHRDDYQDIGRDMLGLRSVAQEVGKDVAHPGLDVVMGTGFGQSARAEALGRSQGQNAVPGNLYLAETDMAKLDADQGGKYVVARTTPGTPGAAGLDAAATRAAAEGKRLFGFYGTSKFNHLPYRTADGRFDPVVGIGNVAESYTPEELKEQPTLVDMTRSALKVLAAKPGVPFALFIEAGDVDFALHDNNLDNAVGAVYSGDDAVRAVVEWVESKSNWDDSALIVTADHGHYLVVDDPKALIAAPAAAIAPAR